MTYDGTNFTEVNNLNTASRNAGGSAGGHTDCCIIRWSGGSHLDC